MTHFPVISLDSSSLLEVKTQLSRGIIIFMTNVSPPSLVVREREAENMHFIKLSVKLNEAQSAYAVVCVFRGLGVEEERTAARGSRNT